jgi:YD repeat-containing protein
MPEKPEEPEKKPTDASESKPDSGLRASAVETVPVNDKRSPIERMQESLTISSNCSPDVAAAYKTIEEQLKTVGELKEDSPEYRYLHSADPAEREKIREGLRAGAQSDDPDKASKSISALKTINFVEAATKLAGTLDTEGAAAADGRRDALRQLYGLRRSEPGDDGPAATVLDSIASKEPIASDLSRAVMNKEWEQFVLDEQAGSQVERVFSGSADAGAAIKELGLLNKSELDQGNDRLAAAARCCQKLAPLFENGGVKSPGVPGIVECLNRWKDEPDKQSSAEQIGKVLEAAGIVKRDGETGEYVAIAGAQVDFQKVRSGLLDAKTDRVADEHIQPDYLADELRKLFETAEFGDAVGGEHADSQVEQPAETGERGSTPLDLKINEVTQKLAEDLQCSLEGGNKPDRASREQLAEQYKELADLAKKLSDETGKPVSAADLLNRELAAQDVPIRAVEHSLKSKPDHKVVTFHNEVDGQAEGKAVSAVFFKSEGDSAGRAGEVAESEAVEAKSETSEKEERATGDQPTFKRAENGKLSEIELPAGEGKLVKTDKGWVHLDASGNPTTEGKVDGFSEDVLKRNEDGSIKGEFEELETGTLRYDNQEGVMEYHKADGSKEIRDFNTYKREQFDAEGKSTGVEYWDGYGWRAAAKDQNGKDLVSTDPETGITRVQFEHQDGRPDSIERNAKNNELKVSFQGGASYSSDWDDRRQTYDDGHGKVVTLYQDAEGKWREPAKDENGKDRVTKDPETGRVTVAFQPRNESELKEMKEGRLSVQSIYDPATGEVTSKYANGAEVTMGRDNELSKIVHGNGGSTVVEQDKITLPNGTVLVRREHSPSEASRTAESEQPSEAPKDETKTDVRAGNWDIVENGKVVGTFDGDVSVNAEGSVVVTKDDGSVERIDGSGRSIVEKDGVPVEITEANGNKWKLEAGEPSGEFKFTLEGNQKVSYVGKFELMPDGSLIIRTKDSSGKEIGVRRNKDDSTSVFDNNNVERERRFDNGAYVKRDEKGMPAEQRLPDGSVTSWNSKGELTYTKSAGGEERHFVRDRESGRILSVTDQNGTVTDRADPKEQGVLRKVNEDGNLGARSEYGLDGANKTERQWRLHRDAGGRVDSVTDDRGAVVAKLDPSDGKLKEWNEEKGEFGQPSSFSEFDSKPPVKAEEFVTGFTITRLDESTITARQGADGKDKLVEATRANSDRSQSTFRTGDGGREIEVERRFAGTDGPYLKRDSHGCVTETRDAYGTIRQFKYAENRKPGDQPIQVIEPGEPPKVVAERVEDAQGGRTRSVLREVVSEGPPKQYGAPCRYLADGAQERTMPPDKEKGLPETVRYQFLDGRQLVATTDGKLLWDYNPVLASKETEERIAAARSRWETEDLSAITSSSDLRSRADEAVAVYLDRNAFEGDRERAYEALKMLSQSEAGKEDKQLQETLANFEAIEKARQVLLSTLDPEKTAEALESLQAYAKGDPPNAIAQQLLEAIVGSDVNGSGYEALLKALNEGGRSAKDAIEIVLERLEPAVQSAVDQQRLSLITKNVSSVSSVEDLNKANRALMQEAAQGNRQALDLAIVTRAMIKSAENRHEVASSSSAKLSFLPDGRVERVQQGDVTTKFQYGSDGKTVRVVEISRPDIDKPGSTVSVSYELEGQSVVNPKTGELTVVAKTGGAGSLARTETVYSPDGSSKVTSYNDSGLRVEQIATTRNEQGEVQTLRTSYVRLDDNGRKIDGVLSAERVIAVQKDASGTVIKEETFSSESDVESGKPLSRHSIDKRESSGNETVERHTFTRAGSSGTEEVVAIVSKTTNRETGERTFIEEFKHGGETRTVRLDGQNQPLELKRKIGADTFEYQFKNGAIDSVTRNGHPVTGADLDRLRREGKAILDLARSERLIALTPTERSKPSTEEPSQTDFQPGESKSEGERPDGDTPAERPAAAQAPVDLAKLKQEIDELVAHADAESTNTSKVDMPDGQWRKFDRDESGKLLRISESNGTTWLSGDGKSFVNAGTGERRQGEVLVAKDGSYKFVLDGNKEIRRNTDNSETFSDSNGSVTINSDNSKLVRNSNGALVLIADAAGRVTRLEPTNRGAEDQPTRVTLPGGKVWERVGDKLWKQPDSIDPVTEQKVSGDTMNGDWVVGTNGDVTIESAKGKESITFKIDGSIVNRNEEGRVVKVEDKFGRSQVFSYKNNELVGTQDYDGTRWSKVSDGIWLKEGSNHIWKGNRSVDVDGTLRLAAPGRELVRRTDGWEEQRDTQTGKVTFHHKTPDNAIVVKNQGGQIVEMRFANGDFRKFDYDQNGAINKVVSKSGDVLTTTDGINWKNQSRPSEPARQVTFEVGANGLFREVSGDGKTEIVHKGDGSTILAKDGKIVEVTDPFGQTRKLKWDDAGNLTAVEQPAAGTVWRKTGDSTWQQETRSGEPMGPAVKAEFKVDGQGNILQKSWSGQELSTTIFRSSGEVEHVEAQLRESPQSNGARTFTNERGQIVKVVDAAGKVAEFGYDAQNRLSSIKNDAGKFVSADGVNWKPEGAVAVGAARLVPGNGKYEVLKDGTVKETLPDGKSQRFYRTDDTTVVRDELSVKTLDDKGRITETIDSSGGRTRFEYGTVKRVVDGRTVEIPDQLSRVSYPNGVVFSTGDGLNWQGENGSKWLGVIVLKKDGTLIEIDMEGKETRRTLDGKVAVEERKDLLAKVDDAYKMLTEWFSDQSVWGDAAQAAELDKKFTGMPAAEVQIVFNMLAQKLDASKQPDELLKSYLGEGHHWEKVVGHLSRADEANFEKVAGDDAAVIRTALTELGQITGDRSYEGCQKAIRLTLQKLTPEQILELSAEYQRRYGEDLKTVLEKDPNLSQFTRDSIALYMKDSDKITSQDRINHMIKACNSRVIDHFEESCLGTSQEERDKVIADNGGYDQIMLKLWNMYGGLSTRDWLHAREALLYGGQTEAQKIRDSVGIFSNDEANIEKVLKEMSSERREMFFRGEYLQSHQSEIKSDADKRAHGFYRNLAYAFDTTHYNANWNKGLRLEQMRDQVMVQGGGLIEKLGTHKGFWTDATKDVVATVHDMTRSDWDALVSDPKYMERLDLHVGTAIGAENFAPIKQLLQSKLDFKALLDQSDSKELKEKSDHFNNMSDSDLKSYVAGRALAKDLQSRSIDDNGRFDPFKLAKLEGELKAKAASGDERAKKDLQSLELYRSETFKAVRDGVRRYVVDALGDTAGDAKAGIDIILKMTSEERKLYKASRVGFDLEGPVQTALHDKVKTVFGLGTPAYETAMNLLKQIRDGKDNDPPKLSAIDKLNLLTYDSSRKASDVVRAVEEAFKEDKTLRDSLKHDSKLAEEFKTAAIRALSGVPGLFHPQTTYDNFVKPLIEKGNLSADQLVRINRIDPDLIMPPDRESFNKHLMSLGPEALHRLNANPSEKDVLLRHVNVEDRKVLESILAQASKLAERRAEFLDSLSADSGQRQILEKVLQQGGPKTAEEKSAVEKLSESQVKQFGELVKDWKKGAVSASDEMRLFVLGSGVDAQRVKSLLGDMDLSQRRQLFQEYASKYGLRDLKRDLVEHADSGDRPQIEYLLRTSEFAAGLKLNIAVEQATTSDGISSSLMRYTGYGGTLTELRQDLFDMQSEVASANREKRPVDEKLIDEMEASFRESLVNFRVAKEQFADSIVNTALTAAALASAPFTGGASLAPILYGMAAGAALKVGTHYMVSGADFEISVNNIGRKMASGMVEGGFAMVNPGQLGAMVGLGKAAAGQAAVLTVKELNALAGGLGAKAMTEAGEQMLQAEMKKLVGAALANRVAGVAEKDLAALAQKVVAQEFGELAEAEAKQLVAKLTESMSKNLQQAIASETKTFLQQVHKEVFHQGANAFIGSGSAVAGTLVDQYFTGKFDGGALMQAGGEGAFGGLVGSSIGRGLHGVGQLRNVDNAGAATRVSFAMLQAVGSGLGADVLTQGSLHGSVDISWDTMFSTLLDAGSGVKDAGSHGGPPHPHRRVAGSHGHDPSGTTSGGNHGTTHRPAAEGSPAGTDGSARPAGDSHPVRPGDQHSETAGPRHGEGSSDTQSDARRPRPSGSDSAGAADADRTRDSSRLDSDTGEDPNYRNKADKQLADLMYDRADTSDENERAELEKQIVKQVEEEVKKTLRELGVPEDLIQISFDLDNTDLKIDYTDPLEMIGIGAQQAGFTAGSYYPASHKLRVDFGSGSPTTTLRHEIQHWYNATQRTILAKADPVGFESGVRESVKRQIGDGGKRLQDDGRGGPAELVERLSLSAQGKEHLADLFDTVLPIAKAGEAVPSEATVRAVLNDPAVKGKVQELLKEMGGDTKENRERLVSELRGEISHYQRVMEGSTISESTLAQNEKLKHYVEEQAAKFREIAARPQAVSEEQVARRELIDSFLKERGADAHPPTAEELHEWLKNLPVYDPAVNAAGDLEAAAKAMSGEIAHWKALMNSQQAQDGQVQGGGNRELADFISKNRRPDQTGEEYVRALTDKYTSGTSDSYTGRGERQEYRVGREERSAKVAEHVFELRRQLAERTFDPANDVASAIVLENLRVESRLALIQVSLERGDLQSKSVQKAAENLVKFLQEKNGDYFKSAEIAKLLVDTGLVTKAELEQAGLGKLVKAMEAGSPDAGESADDAMHSEQTVRRQQDGDEGEGSPPTARQRDTDDQPSGNVGGDSTADGPFAGDANFRSPKPGSVPELPAAVVRDHTYSKVPKAEFDKEVAKIGEQFSTPTKTFVETPKLLSQEFSGNLTPNQIIAKLRERGLKDADIFAIDPVTGKKSLKITRDQFEKLAVTEGKPVEMVSFKVGGLEVEMTAELAKVHEKIRELRKTIAAGEGSTEQQRRQFRQAEADIKQYDKVPLPEEVIAHLRRTPDPRLCEKLIMADKQSPNDVWLTLKSTGENEGKWDSVSKALGWAGIVHRTITIAPAADRTTIGWTVQHEWSHLLEGADKRFRNIFETATRVEKALGEDNRYFLRDYSTFSTSEDWATGVGEVFLKQDPSDFHAMVQSAKEGSSKAKVLVELCAALRAAEQFDKSRLSQGRAADNIGRFHDLQEMRARFEYAKKELLDGARSELLAHIERNQSNPSEAIDAIRVLSFIGDPQAGNRMMEMAASVKDEKVACELYKFGRLAAGGPPLDAKAMIELSQSSAKAAVLPDLIRLAGKDEQVKAHLLERLEKGEFKDARTSVRREELELLTSLALGHIESLQDQPERAAKCMESLLSIANPEMGGNVFEAASRIHNKEVAAQLYLYGKALSGGMPDTATLIALSESGAKLATIPDLIRQSLRDPDAKAYLEKCLKRGDFTDSTKFDKDESLAILGELLRESSLEDQSALFADIMDQLADKPELKSDFLVTAALDDGVDDSLRQRAAQELEDFADERLAATLVSGGNGLSGTEVDKLVNQYSKGEGNVSHKTMATALREYGIREMKRLGFGDKAIELMGPKYFGTESFDGSSLGGYDPMTGQIGIAVGRKLIEKLKGEMIHASSTTTHELRHRVNVLERTALSIAHPVEFRNALVDDVVQHIGQGGHRAEPDNSFFGRVSDFFGKKKSVNTERLNATPEEGKFMSEAVRKYLTEPADGTLGKPIDEKSLAKWMEKSGLKIPEGSDSRKLLQEMVGEISHANLVKEKSVLPPELVKGDPVLRKCLEERVKMYGNAEEASGASIRKLVRGMSDDIGALVTRQKSDIDRVKDAHYLFSIEEVRARRTQHAAEINQAMAEVKSLIRNNSEAKDALRSVLPPSAAPSEILKLGDEAAMAQYLTKLKATNPDLAKAIEQVRDRPKTTAADIKSGFEEMVTLINSGPGDLKELLVDQSPRDPLESQMKQLVADDNALSAFLAKLRQTDAARAEAIEKRLAKMDQIVEKIQFNNAIEQFHTELKNLRSFDDPHLAQDVAARMVVEKVDGKNEHVPDRPELARARLNASIEKILQMADQESFNTVLSQLYDKGISAEQIMQSVPASKAGEVAAYLYQRDPAKCNLKELLKMTSADKLESVVVGLLTLTDLQVYQFGKEVAREDLHRLTAILAKQPDFNLGMLTQIMINSNRLDDFLQTSLNEGVVEPAQIEALVAERRKNGDSLQDTEKIAGIVRAWRSSSQGP